VLESSADTWWISGPGSMRAGQGCEWLAISLGAEQPRRIERVELRIPPMPSGPLSVRDFHLETAVSIQGPWTRASHDFVTLDVPDPQSWVVKPPIEATLVRVSPPTFARAPFLEAYSLTEKLATPLHRLCVRETRRAHDSTTCVNGWHAEV
jgi:hypothetical protein